MKVRIIYAIHLKTRIFLGVLASTVKFNYIYFDITLLQNGFYVVVQWPTFFVTYHL